METIHPNNIQDLDRDTISFITLKDGNMIMVDDSAPEKPNKETTKSDDNQINNAKKKQPLTISNQQTISFKGGDIPTNTNNNLFTFNNSKNTDNNNNKIIVKSDFNKISHIAKITNFTYKGNPRQNLVNNIPTLPINKNNNILLNNNNNNNNNVNSNNNVNIPQSLNNFSPIISKNNINNQNNQNELLNNNNNTKRSDDNNTSSNNIIIVNHEENKEGEDISARIRRKSRNYLEKIEKLVGDMNKPTIKAVISLNIPSDVQKNISKTQKQFDQLVVQLRQKQNKYRKNKSEVNYPKYYEFYKNDKFNGFFNSNIPNLNRIKYYEESAKEDLENNFLFNGNDNLKKSVNMNNNVAAHSPNRSIYDNISNRMISTNKSTNFHNRQSSVDYSMNKSMNNFFVAKNKTINNNSTILFNSRQGSSFLGNSSYLVFPSNRCRSKLNPFY